MVRGLEFADNNGLLTSVHICLFIRIGDRELAFRVVTSDILEHSVTLPYGLVIVPMINEGRDTSIGHECDIGFTLLLLFREIEGAYSAGYGQILRREASLLLTYT